MRGITCIAVNTKFVKDYPRDYTIYDREDLAGRMTLLDGCVERLLGKPVLKRPIFFVRW